MTNCPSARRVCPPQCRTIAAAGLRPDAECASLRPCGRSNCSASPNLPAPHDRTGPPLPVYISRHRIILRTASDRSIRRPAPRGCQGYRERKMNHSKRAPRRHGHLPGHVREPSAAIEAYRGTATLRAAENTSPDQLPRQADQHRGRVWSGVGLHRHHARDRISVSVRVPDEQPKREHTSGRTPCSPN